MSPQSFEPEGFTRPVEAILPDEPAELDLNAATTETSDVVTQLAGDISGVGPKAAQRYLLRFEYGFNTDTLTQEYEITRSTLSKQTNQVHRAVLTHPTLAREVGQFRTERAGLTQPDLDDQTLWEGELELHSKPIYVVVNYFAGDRTTPYSWQVDVTADLNLTDKTRRLRCSYLVDEEYGVLLKRVLKGLSHTDGDRFRYERLRTCHIYPLPHPTIPAPAGTLLDRLQYHVSYDIKKCFEDPAWSSIEDMITFVETSDTLPRPLPEWSQPETITGDNTSSDQVRRYTKEVHRRKNLEHILRLYPTTRVEHIPVETVDLLWDGSVATAEDYLNDLLRTSEPHYHPGPHRTIWALNNTGN
jgi:hypothetical protein